jgi:hypothetical protein
VESGNVNRGFNSKAYEIKQVSPGRIVGVSGAVKGSSGRGSISGTGTVDGSGIGVDGTSGLGSGSISGSISGGKMDVGIKWPSGKISFQI